MPAKRVIPCLDVTEGRVVKGVRFQDLRDAGDPAELAAAYGRLGGQRMRSSSRSRWVAAYAACRTWASC